MSITVATAVVAPSAPSSVAAPAAPPAGARNDAFQDLLETYSSASSGTGDGSELPTPRSRTDGATTPAGLASALTATKGGTALKGTDVPLDADGRAAADNPSSQTSALGNVLVLQVLPLPTPVPAAQAGSALQGSAAQALSLEGPGSKPDARVGHAPGSGLRAAGTQDSNAEAGRSTLANPAAQRSDLEARSPTPESAIVTAAYGATPTGESAAATQDSSPALGPLQGANNPLPQVIGPSLNPRNGTTSAPLADLKGPGPRAGNAGSMQANAPVDRPITTAESIRQPPAAFVPAAAAVALPVGPAGSGALEFEAGQPAESATRMPAAPASTEMGAQAAVTPRDQTPVPASTAGATPTGNPARPAVDRRSAAGVRLAAALARSARAEGAPGAGSAQAPNRLAADAAPSVDSDLRTVSTSAPVDVAQAVRLGDRMRTESPAPGAAVSAAEPMAVRLGAAEAGDLRRELAPSAESGSDIKTSALPGVFAAPAGVLGVGASSRHTVSAATTTQPAIDPAAESDLPRQIVQGMRLQWKDGIGDARIRLMPDYLGELSVAIRVEHGSVVASLEASTPAVRQWIESHEPMLRHSLAEQGLLLDRLIVLDEPQETTANPNRERRREKGGDPEQQPQSRRRPAVDDTTFEVIV